MKKRALSLFLTLCILSGLFHFPTYAAEKGTVFTDVSSSVWYSDAVEYVYHAGLMSGTGQTTFSPNLTLTRGMLVTILYSMEGKPGTGRSQFPDVADSDYYGPGAAWAAEHSIVSGYPDGRFGPNDWITREQMAVILYRYMLYKGYDCTKQAQLSTFTDMDQAASYAVEALQWAVGAGLLSGIGNNRLAPGGNATRAQAAVILMRLDQSIKSASTPSSSTSNTSSSPSSSGGGSSSGGSGGNSPSTPGGSGSGGTDTPSTPPVSGGEGAAADRYAITDLSVAGQTVTAVLSTEETCTLEVQFLSEDGKSTLFIVTTGVDGGLSLAERSSSIGQTLPAHFQMSAVLKDAGGTALCNPFVSIAYTKAFEKFSELTPKDFPEQQVVDFAGNPADDATQTNNFGVLTENVKTLDGDANCLEGEQDGVYTFSSASDALKAAQPDDLLYIPGTDIMLKVGKAEIQGEKVVITSDPDVTLSDFYQVFKVDMDIPLEGRVTLAQQPERSLRRATPAAMSRAGSEDPGDKSLSFGFKFGIEGETTGIGGVGVTANGEINGKLTVHLKSEYDPQLLGEDYYMVETWTSTETIITVEADGYFTGGGDIPIIPAQHIPIPAFPAASVYVKLSIPVRAQLSAGLKYELNTQDKRGVYFCSKGGPQLIQEHTASESFGPDNTKPNLSFEGEVSLAAEAGVGLLQDCLTVGIVLSGGAEVELEGDSDVGKVKEPGYHACTVCLGGKSDYFASLTIEGSYEVSKLLRGDIIKVTVAKTTWEEKDLYLSIINESSSCHGGKIAFGEGQCPNWKYKATITTKNAMNQDTHDQVTVKYQDNTDAFTGPAPFSVYLYNNRAFIASAVIDDKTVSTQSSLNGNAKTIVLQAAKASVSGKVTDTDGNPLSGAMVTAKAADGSEAASPSSTREDGSYSLLLPAGTFTLSAEKTGYMKGTVTLTVEERDSRTHNFQLAVSLGTVTGKVTDKETGDPISGALVEVKMNSNIYHCTTDASGSYTSESIPSGTYVVTVSANNYGTVSKPGVVVESGQSATCDVSLAKPEAQLTVTVRNGDGAAVSGAVVTLSGGETTVSGKTDSSGQVTLKIASGSYTLKVTADNYADHSESVSLDDGSKMSKTVTLSKTGEWDFVVQSREGDLIQNALVSLLYQGSTHAWAYTDAEGRATLNLDNGKFQYGTEYQLRVTHTSCISHSEQITLTAGQALPLKTVTLTYGGTENGVTWTLIDGVLTFSGNGAMKHCTNSSTSLAPWHFNNKAEDYLIHTVIVEEGITSIGGYAFYNFKALENVTLPSTITMIRSYAFHNCTALTSITIPDSVTEIEDRAFELSGLTSINIPDSVTTFGENIFTECENLASAELPSNMSEIGPYMFYKCKSLTHIEIPDTVSTIGWGAFSGSGLTQITIPSNVRTIHNNAFSASESLRDLVISDGVESIYSNAFSSCNGLTSVYIPDSVTKMSSSLSTITSSNLQFAHIFYECNNLKNIYYGGDESAWNTAQQAGQLGSVKKLEGCTVHYNISREDYNNLG